MSEETVVVGYTPTKITFDQMKQIDAAVDALDAAVQAHVKRPAFRDAWGAWKKAWKSFFEDYSSKLRRLGATFLLSSDDLARQTDGYRTSLEKWYEAYAAEGDLPKPAGVVPGTNLPPKKDEEEGFTVPTWLWVLAATLGVGGAYLMYRAWQNQNLVRSRFLAALPEIAPGLSPESRAVTKLIE